MIVFIILIGIIILLGIRAIFIMTDIHRTEMGGYPMENEFDEEIDNKFYEE